MEARGERSGVGDRMLVDQLKTIPGWLHDVAAHATTTLLDAQQAAGLRGPILEIGVFGGRYLALLADHAARTGDPTVGIDIYIYIDEAQVRRNIESVGVPTTGVSLVRANSTALDTAGLIESTGGRPRFISVDGDHAASAVYHDLTIVRDAMTQSGVIAIDDFLNPLAFGVNEGVNRFFFDGSARDLRPVCYTGGKLFVAYPDHVEFYRGALQRFAETHSLVPETARYRELAAQNRAYVMQPLFGHEVLVIGER